MARFKDKDERDFRLYKSTPNQKTSLEFNKIKVGKSSLRDDVTLDPDFWYKNNRPIRREDVDRAISTNSVKELRRISNYFFNTSGIYSRLCRYMAFLYKYDWFITPVVKDDSLKPEKIIIKDVLNISIPTTGSRIIGTIGYFLEPIVLTSFLLMNGYTTNYITYEYGVLTGYVMPLLLLPSFFTMAISQATLPVISNGYANNKIPYVKKKIKQSLLLSFAIGLFFTIILMIFPEIFMKLIYNTNEGVSYIRKLAPFFLLLYIQTPLVSVMQALDKAKDAMHSTLVGSIIKIALIIILSFFEIGLYPLVIATVVNIIYVTVFNYIKVKKIFKNK